MSRCDGLGDPATQAAKAQAVDRGLHRTGSQVLAVVATLAGVLHIQDWAQAILERRPRVQLSRALIPELLINLART